MIDEFEKSCGAMNSIGSGGSLTYELVKEHDATYGSSMLKPLVGAMAATMAAFATPPSAGGVLVFKGRSGEQQSALWILEHATHTYGAEDTPDAPWKEQLLQIKDVLQLTVSDIARFTGVERPSVYHWLAGARPRPAKQQRIDMLGNLTRIWASYRLGPISAYLTRTVGETHDTLEAFLTRPDFNLNAIEAHVRSLAEISGQLMRTRQSVSDRLAARGFKPSSGHSSRVQRARVVRSTSSGEE